ncbi:hypothetical protein [Yinghuangia sp. YIM S09857]|uniref:hypothetical protein n=1 Tax=Yinghuangia sp. YIM S09857 TaxID=3436929 RepID=UPI003F536160
MRIAADNERTCAPRAEILHEGIPYVRGWNAADDATRELAGVLMAAGLAVGFGALKADVNVHGDGLVNLGSVPADVVAQLAELLTRGLCAEMAQRAA